MKMLILSACLLLAPAGAFACSCTNNYAISGTNTAQSYSEIGNNGGASNGTVHAYGTSTAGDGATQIFSPAGNESKTYTTSTGYGDVVSGPNSYGLFTTGAGGFANAAADFKAEFVGFSW